jgi:hypothetical protein
VAAPTMMTTPVRTTVPMAMITTVPLTPSMVVEPFAMLLSPSDVRRGDSVVSTLLCRRYGGEPERPAERGGSKRQGGDPTTNDRRKEIRVHDFVLRGRLGVATFESNNCIGDAARK